MQLVVAGASYLGPDVGRVTGLTFESPHEAAGALDAVHAFCVANSTEDKIATRSTLPDRPDFIGDQAVDISVAAAHGLRQQLQGHRAYLDVGHHVGPLGEDSAGLLLGVFGVLRAADLRMSRKYQLSEWDKEGASGARYIVGAVGRTALGLQAAGLRFAARVGQDRLAPRSDESLWGWAYMRVRGDRTVQGYRVTKDRTTGCIRAVVTVAGPVNL